MHNRKVAIATFMKTKKAPRCVCETLLMHHNACHFFIEKKEIKKLKENKSRLVAAVFVFGKNTS